MLVFKVYLQFVHHCFRFKVKSALLLDSRTEQPWSWYITLTFQSKITAHRKTKSCTLYIMMTINRIHRVFTSSTSCLTDSTCCDCRDGAADALGVKSGRSGLCLVFIRQQLGFRVVIPHHEAEWCVVCVCLFARGGSLPPNGAQSPF